VVLAGIISTVITLVGVWWLDRNTTDLHIMGWYANYILPAGAIIVGLAAGSGYGVASWVTGLKIRRSLLATVLGLQLAAYASAEYIEFRDVARQAGVSDTGAEFLAYYRWKAVNFAWREHGRTGKPLGGWGYLFVALGLVGFLAGGVAAPALLRRVPYCERCELYMRSRRLTMLPASVKHRRVSKRKAAEWAAYQEEQRQAAEAAAERLRQLGELAGKGDGFGLKSAVAQDQQGAKAAGKLPTRISVNLVHCRSCLDAHLQPVSITGHGKQQRATRLDRIPAGPEITRALRDG
jgi:hypothetical protein